jgi:phosphonate transport system substrate-binding protein
MTRDVRFALFADPKDARPAFDEMATLVQASTGLHIEPLFVSSYAGLAQALEHGACDAAWSPPIVAQGLLASAIGKPLVAVGRRGRTSYFAVLVARADGPPAEGLQGLARARVGWVSKLSAAGYVVPSLYLRSLGLEPDELFAEQSFLGSHDAVARALDEGAIDVAATYATVTPGGRTLVLPSRVNAGARILAAAGPIPGDVIFAAAQLNVRTRDALRGAFLSMRVPEEGPLAQLMSVDRFEVPTLDHFETLRRWRTRAIESEPRMRVAK